MLPQGNGGAWPHRRSGRPWILSEVKFAVPENQPVLAIAGMDYYSIQVKTLIFVGEILSSKQEQRLLASRSYFLCNLVKCDARWRYFDKKESYGNMKHHDAQIRLVEGGILYALLTLYLIFLVSFNICYLYIIIIQLHTCFNSLFGFSHWKGD